MRGIRVATQRLDLIAVWDELARAAVEDRGKLAQMIDAQVPDEWPPEVMADVMEYFAKRLEEDPQLTGWWVWYLVLNQENFDRVLIGSAGFNGYPDEDGSLLIGYSVLSAYQGCGYTTEAVRGLLGWAFDHPHVMSVSAETFSDHMASIRVMEKNNMISLGEGSAEGLLKYQITRDRYKAFTREGLKPPG